MRPQVELGSLDQYFDMNSNDPVMPPTCLEASRTRFDYNQRIIANVSRKLTPQ